MASKVTGNSNGFSWRLHSRLSTRKAAENFIRASFGMGGPGGRIRGFLEDEFLRTLHTPAFYFYQNIPALLVVDLWKSLLERVGKDSGFGYRLRFRLQERGGVEVTKEERGGPNRRLCKAIEAAIEVLSSQLASKERLGYIVSARIPQYGTIVDALLFPKTQFGSPINLESLVSGTGSRRICSLVAEAGARAAETDLEISIRKAPVRSFSSTLPSLLAVFARVEANRRAETECSLSREDLLADIFDAAMKSSQLFVDYSMKAHRRLVDLSASSREEQERQEKLLSKKLTRAKQLLAESLDALRKLSSRSIRHENLPDAFSKVVQNSLARTNSSATPLILIFIANMLHARRNREAMQLLRSTDIWCNVAVAGSEGVELTEEDELVQLAARVLSAFEGGNAIKLIRLGDQFREALREKVRADCRSRAELRRRERCRLLRRIRAIWLLRRALKAEISALDDSDSGGSAFLKHVSYDVGRRPFPDFTTEIRAAVPEMMPCDLEDRASIHDDCNALVGQIIRTDAMRGFLGRGAAADPSRSEGMALSVEGRIVIRCARKLIRRPS